MTNIKKNFGYQVAYRILTVITPLITAPIISRALGAERVGMYSATQAYANYFMLFAMLGVEYYGQRTIAAANSIEKRQSLFWEIFAVQAVASTISLLVYLSSIFFFEKERFLVMLFQGLWVVSSFLDINWFFFGVENFKLTVTRNFVVKIVTVFSIVFVIRQPGDLPLYTLIMAGSTAMSQMVLWVSLRRYIHFQKSSFQEVKKHILPILQLFIPMLASSIYHFMDKTMLDVLSNEAEVGYYYSADKIIYIPLGVITAVGTVMLPRISNVLNNETFDKAEDLLNKASELDLFLASAVGFGIGAIAEEFAPLFFGVGYEPVGMLIRVFVPVLMIKALSDVVRSQYLIPAKKDKQYTMSVTCGAAMNIICNTILIPELGALGAVLGTLAAETIVLIMAMLSCRKEINFLRIFMNHWIYLACGVVMFVGVRIIANILVDVPVFIRLVIMVASGGAIYMILCFCVWRFKKESIFRRYVESIKRKIVRGKI